MPVSRRRASPALSERAAEIYGFIPELKSMENSFEETIARVALNTLVESAQRIPHWEEKLSSFQIQEREAGLKTLGLMADGASQKVVGRAMKQLERLGDQAAIVERRIRSCQVFPAMVEKTFLTTPEIAAVFQKLLTEVLHDAEGNSSLTPEEQAAYAFVAEKYGEEIR